MKVIDQFRDPFDKKFPITLTIGNFDGVHQGHQALLSRVVENAKKEDGKSCVITFSNHPKELFDPDFHPKFITTPHHRLNLIEEIGIDGLILIPFTKEFSEQTASEFLEHLSSHFQISTLVLGYDARIGKNREGDKQTVLDFANSHSLNVEYIDEKLVEGTPISSTRVRKAIQTADFKAAEKLLGRPYSILSPIKKKDGSYTISLPNLILPHEGTYQIRIKQNNQLVPAQLTLQEQQILILPEHPLNDSESEIFFL